MTTVDEVAALWANVPEPIDGVYEMGDANQRIPLYVGPVTIRTRRPGRSDKLCVRGELALEWFPFPAVRFRMPKHVGL